MITLNTIRSEKMAGEFLAKKKPYKRKVQVYVKQISADPEAAFQQLCPTREAFKSTIALVRPWLWK